MKIKWTCPKEGRFRVAHCANCPWHYCYDGQHFFEEDGPVPAWVKEYFDNMIRKMEQDRAEIQRKVQEGQAHWQQAQADTARMSASRSHVLRPMAQEFPVERAAPTAAAPKPVPLEKFQAVKAGMDRTEVIESLGTPQSSMSIPDENGVTERLSYQLTDGRWVKIVIQNGKVSEVKGP